MWQRRVKTQSNPYLANAKRKSNLKFAGKSILKARLGDRARTLKIIVHEGNRHSPLLGRMLCGLVSDSWRPTSPSFLEAFLVPGQSCQGTECLAVVVARLPVGRPSAHQCGRQPGPGSRAAFLSAPVIPSFALGTCHLPPPQAAFPRVAPFCPS